MYATLATSTLKSTPHVAGFRARNGAASSFPGQRLAFRSTFVGEHISFVSKWQEITPVGVRSGDVCVPRASLDQYAPLTAALYGACLLGGGLFACKCRSEVHSSCKFLRHSLNCNPPLVVLLLLFLYFGPIIWMCLHCCSDTRTGSKGSLGGGITGGVALGVVSSTSFLKFSLCTKCRLPYFYYSTEICGNRFHRFDNF